jgi:hypothetical protein
MGEKESMLSCGGANLLGKVIPEVLDVEDQRSGLSLVFPYFTIGIKDTMAKQFPRAVIQHGSLYIVFKVC